MTDTITRAKDLLGLVRQARELNRHQKKEELGFLAENIIFAQAEFIKDLVETEQAYRQRIRELMEKEDLSFAAAENKAMCEEVYAIYKKVKHIYSLAEEQIRLLKLMISNSY